MGGAFVGEFARVPGGSVFLATRVGALDETAAADGVTGGVDAGFAAVGDLGAAAASGWVDGVSLVAATGASLSAEVAPGFSGC